MRDSFSSPRHYHQPKTSTTTGGGIHTTTTNAGLSRTAGTNSGHPRPSQPLQSRPPFSPTNPKNVTNHRASNSTEGDHSNNTNSNTNSNDPWKMSHNFPSPSNRKSLFPPNPEGRLPRVSSAPNHPSRTFSRGRLMEGPLVGATSSKAAETPNVWDPLHSGDTEDDPVPWPTSTTTTLPNATTSTGMNDDSTWFVEEEGDKNHRSSPKISFQWGRRTRSNDFPSTNTTDPWQIPNGTSADSGERSLYDDSGEKIIRIATTTPPNPRPITSSRSFLGSAARPIHGTTTAAAVKITDTLADGSLNRPIAIHDCADVVLEEREHNVLQNAARKQLESRVLDADVVRGDDAVALENAIVDDDVRDSDILQKATKRRQGLLEKKKLQQQSHGIDHKMAASAITLNNNNSSSKPNSELHDDDDAGSAKQIPTPKQNKGILGFFRGSVSLKSMLPVVRQCLLGNFVLTPFSFPLPFCFIPV